jgi:hypothetical protein
MTPSELLDLYYAHQWPILAALAVGLLVRLVKAGRLTLPITVPAQYRSWLAIALGVASGVAEAIVAGTPWREALIGGVASAAAAIVGHETLVENARKGRELGEPKAKTGDK